MHRWAGRLGRLGRRARKRVLKRVLFLPQNKYGKSTPQKNAKKRQKWQNPQKNGKNTRVFPRKRFSRTFAKSFSTPYKTRFFVGGCRTFPSMFACVLQICV
jgi:hypothetical protein